MKLNVRPFLCYGHRRSITYRYFDHLYDSQHRIACKQINPTLHEDDHDWRKAIAPKTATYSQILTFAHEISRQVLGRKSVGIALGTKVHVSTIAAIFGCWMAGAAIVPIDCHKSPGAHIEQLASLTKIDSVIVSRVDSSETYRGALYTGQEIIEIEGFNPRDDPDLQELQEAPNFNDNDVACVLCTSGSSTGLPRCVPLTHRNLKFQMEDMIEAWKWSKNDRIIHLLPINHIHGLVNCLLTPLYAGAECLLATNMHPINVWRYLKDPGQLPITILMAVPTVFNRLVRQCRDLEINPNFKVEIADGLRLVVCGSAPCTQVTYDKWYQLTGHQIVERYGMTETGMILTNSIDPVKNQPGTVGMPMPSMKVRMRSDEGRIVVDSDGSGKLWFAKQESPLIGSLEVTGPGVAAGYLNDTDRGDAYTEDGYFLTGDIAKFDREKTTFKLLGRQGLDILKVGGHKVSALNVERAILGHPDIGDCAVVGVDDPEQWGQKIVAFVAPLNPAVNLDNLRTSRLRQWASQWLPKHELPAVVHIVKDLERNVMGKLRKQKLIERHFELKREQ